LYTVQHFTVTTFAGGELRDYRKHWRCCCYLYRTVTCSLPTWCSVPCYCSLDKGSHSC